MPCMVLFYNELSVSVYNANDVVSCSMSRSELLRAFVYFWSLGILIFFCVLFGAMLDVAYYGGNFW